MDVVDVIFLVIEFLSRFVGSFIEFVDASCVVEYLTLDVFYLFVQVLDLFHEIVECLAVDCRSI
jgi:hypothetical protein